MNKTVTIKKNYEFSKIYKKSKYYVGKYIVLYVTANKLDINRIGITISRKFGKSVKRNRIRRLIKENYRVYEDTLKKGNDLVFVARKTDDMPTYTEIKKEMKFLFKRLGIYSRETLD